MSKKNSISFYHDDDKKYVQEVKELLKTLTPISNDAFAVFARDKNFCEEFLRVVLQDEKLVVVNNDIQEHLPEVYFKSYTLDMLCKLGDNRIVNVEIQLTKEKEHARRIFQYASAIKQVLVNKGEEYKDVKDLIIIYLTKEDLFKKGSTIYTVEQNIISDQKEFIKKWDAGLTVYYVNIEGLTNKTIHEYLKLLTDCTTINKKYKYLSELKTNYMIKKGVNKMETTVRDIMEKYRDEIMDEGIAQGMEQGISQGIAQGMEQGISQGIAQGMEKGLLQGKINTIVDLYKKNLITIDYASSELGMSEKEFLAILNK